MINTKKTTGQIVLEKFNEAMANNGGDIEAIDTVRFSLNVAAAFDRKVTTIERYLRLNKEAHREKQVKSVG